MQDWSLLAQELVNRRLDVLNVSLASFEPLFDQAVHVNAKSLVILMTIPFAIVLALLLNDKHRPAVTHVVFSLTFYAFLLMWLCVLLLFLLLLRFVGVDIQSHAVDWGLFTTLLAAAAVYIYQAVGVIYGTRGPRRALTVLILSLTVGVGILGYRFVIFLITLYFF